MKNLQVGNGGYIRMWLHSMKLTLTGKRNESATTTTPQTGNRSFIFVWLQSVKLTVRLGVQDVPMSLNFPHVDTSAEMISRAETPKYLERKTLLALRR